MKKTKRKKNILEHFKNLKSYIRNLLCNEKFLLMLKVLELSMPVFLRVYSTAMIQSHQQGAVQSCCSLLKRVSNNNSWANYQVLSRQIFSQDHLNHSPVWDDVGLVPIQHVWPQKGRGGVGDLDLGTLEADGDLFAVNHSETCLSPPGAFGSRGSEREREG